MSACADPKLAQSIVSPAFDYTGAHQHAAMSQEQIGYIAQTEAAYAAT